MSANRHNFTANDNLCPICGFNRMDRRHRAQKDKCSRTLQRQRFDENKKAASPA